MHRRTTPPATELPMMIDFPTEAEGVDSGHWSFMENMAESEVGVDEVVTFLVSQPITGAKTTLMSPKLVLQFLPCCVMSITGSVGVVSAVKSMTI